MTHVFFAWESHAITKLQGNQHGHNDLGLGHVGASKRWGERVNLKVVKGLIMHVLCEFCSGEVNGASTLTSILRLVHSSSDSSCHETKDARVRG